MKLPTIWTDGKAQPRRSAAMEKVRREKIRDDTDQPRRKSEVTRSEMKKIRQDEKAGKSRNTVFVPMFCGYGRSKSKLAKAAGAEASGQMRDEKVHAVVARSTFGRSDVQKTGRRFGAKHMWK